LSNSTILAVAARYNGGTGVSTNGTTIYCERAPTGNDIYKLELWDSGGGATSKPALTYRNDAGVVKQGQGAFQTSILDTSSQVYIATLDATSGTANIWNGRVRTTVTGFPSIAFTNASIERRIGSDAGDAVSKWDGKIDLIAGWNRSLRVNEGNMLAQNPWQIFVYGSAQTLPPYQLIVRALADVLTTGWTPSTGTIVASTINEIVINDTTFSTSPSLLAPQPLIMTLDAPLAAGAWAIEVRANVTSGSGLIKVSLLNDSNVVQGVSAWQNINTSYTTKTVAITTTGTATRVQIETSA
jgi:hypothetical protein